MQRNVQNQVSVIMWVTYKTDKLATTFWRPNFSHQSPAGSRTKKLISSPDFERANNNNCRAFDWTSIWWVGGSAFHQNKNCQNIRLFLKSISSTPKTSLPLRSDSTASFALISKQILNCLQGHLSQGFPFLCGNAVLLWNWYGIYGISFWRGVIDIL